MIFIFFELFSYIWASGKSPEALPSSLHTKFLIQIDRRHPETLLFGILPKMNGYETEMGQGLGPARAGPWSGPGPDRAGPWPRDRAGPGPDFFASVSGVLNLYFSKGN